MNKVYTGIGSRSTPANMKLLIRDFGRYFALSGWTLRSGGADGADYHFEEGCDEFDGKKEIYLPWKGFNFNTSNRYVIVDEAVELAARYHPRWGFLSNAEKKLHSRNVYQVLGYKLDKPSDFLLCWTFDGCSSKKERTSKTGGTGLAIAIADDYGVPVINLKNENYLKLLEKYLT